MALDLCAKVQAIDVRRSAECRSLPVLERAASPPPAFQTMRRKEPPATACYSTFYCSDASALSLTESVAIQNDGNGAIGGLPLTLGRAQMAHVKATADHSGAA
jgi:hypothetical protein